MTRSTTIGLFLSAALAVGSWGCGAGNRGSTDGKGGDAGSSDGGSAGSGNGGSAGNGNGGAGGGFGGFGGLGGGSAGSGGAGGMACAGSTVKGELIPLDMYIMLDKSGSMSDKTGTNGTGPSKWDAVTSALNAFFTDAGSNGLGVGIQFFPTNKPGVPDTCTSNNQCGAAGPCLLKSCDNQGVIVPCTSNSECGFLGNCATLGSCSANKNYYCLYGPQYNPDCGVDANGNSLGTCQLITTSYCVGRDSCDGGDYANPSVEIATLNGAAAGLSAAIMKITPGGATPTAPALDGAVQHAQTWAAAHPDHKVVAVLATDGLPTECDPTDINQIAQIAASGVSANPSILTFVIGVFAQTDIGAQANLDTIAQAGGTNKAFFITSNQDVTMAFLDALHQIQGKTLSCEYQIPTPPDGSDLDYAKVNVEYTPAGSTKPETVFYVGKDSACDPMTGGWYYDVDPMSGKAPTKILMCPATCDQLKNVGGQVDIKIGCQTVVPDPK